MEDYGKLTRKVRLENGLTQPEFAKCLGVSRETVARWECAHRVPTAPIERLLLLLDGRPGRVRELRRLVSR